MLARVQFYKHPEILLLHVKVEYKHILFSSYTNCSYVTSRNACMCEWET